MSGRDLHLPSLRLVAARARSSSSSSRSSGSRGSSSGGRGSSGPRSGSSYSLPSSRTDPSDHSWDSPGWHPQRMRPSTPPLLAMAGMNMGKSPVSSWSTSSSEKKRRATAAARRKHLERIKNIAELRRLSLEAPPERHSPEDYSRIYKMGIYKYSDMNREPFSAPPLPYWCDAGYEPGASDSDSDSSDDHSNASLSPPSTPRPRLVKSEGGSSPSEPGFSLPFLDSSSSCKNSRKRGKGYKKAVMQSRQLFQDCEDID